MKYRHLFPILRLLLPFMAGIIIALQVDACTSISFFIWAIALVFTLLSGHLHYFTKTYGRSWIFGVFLFSFLFISGFNSVILHKEILRPDHFSKSYTNEILISKIVEPIQEKDHSYKTILEVIGVKKHNSIIPLTGKILAYFSKDSLKKSPVAGSVIAFSAVPQEISGPKNPGAFDYKRYMAASNVYNQVYMKSSEWIQLQDKSGFNIYLIADKYRERYISILKRSGLQGREFAVASALILGQTDMLDSETMQDYAGAGVMHILSVSGLHVGVIFMIINFLLGFLKRKKWQQYLKIALILITIWAYALLTGLSPAVCRAALMFTFISFGNLTNRFVHIINSLSVSAFLLLLLNPLVINNIGFQLSYLAIIGIVFINKPIAGLWFPKNRILKYIWELIAVSIAAQVATVPLTMYYFHQFPTYFIPANLIAIPLSGIVIYSGLLVLVTSALPVISSFFGMISSILLWVLNTAMADIEDIPYSVMHINSIFIIEMLLLNLVVVTSILFIHYKHKSLIFTTLFLFLLLSFSFTSRNIQRHKQQKLIVYTINKHSAISCISGRKQTLLADSLLLKDKQSLKYQLSGSETNLGLNDTYPIALDTLVRSGRVYQNENIIGLGGYMICGNKRIAIIDSLTPVKGSIKRLAIDYLIVRNNSKIKITELLKNYQPGLIIIDASNSVYHEDKWLADCIKAKKPVYSIRNSGAFIADL